LLSDYQKALPLGVKLGGDALGYVSLAPSIAGVSSPGGSIEKAIGNGLDTGADAVKSVIKTATDVGIQQSQRQPTVPGQEPTCHPSRPRQAQFRRLQHRHLQRRHLSRRRVLTTRTIRYAEMWPDSPQEDYAQGVR
jgi:hypothetical protein